MMKRLPWLLVACLVGSSPIHGAGFAAEPPATAQTVATAADSVTQTGAETPPPDPIVAQPSPTTAAAQQEEQEPQPPPVMTVPVETPQPPITTERRDEFPNLDIYLPEGEFSIRAKKLIRNVLFESQINYKFVDGDISTFLRYKYYARNFTYKIGFFDTIEFPSLDDASLDFDRVRGALLLFEYPSDYNRRYFLLTQGDFLRFGREDQGEPGRDSGHPDDGNENIYMKFGFQYGSPFDERLNSIVGDTRGRRTPLLTAYREIGPQKVGLGLALTQALGGDYEYTKLQAEVVKRLDFRSSFLMSRLHLGSMLQKTEIVPDPLGGEVDPEDDPIFTVPRYELFRVGGRDALKGIDDSKRGTDELHFTNEFFVPIFRNQHHRMWRLDWTNLYGVGYFGAGTLGFDQDVFAEFGDYIFDAGAGFEASLKVRDFDVYLSAIYAHSIKAPAELEGGEIRFQVRTSR